MHTEETEHLLTLITETVQDAITILNAANDMLAALPDDVPTDLAETAHTAAVAAHVAASGIRHATDALTDARGAFTPRRQP